jgi:hypothetical protein
MPFGNAVGEGFNNGAIVVAEKVIVFGAGDGVFVYNGTPGLGNAPVFVAASPSTTEDPYGNPVDPVVQLGSASGAHINVDQFGELVMFNSAGQIVMFMQPGLEAIFMYAPPAGAGSLIISVSSTSGTDNFGNAYLQGHTTYNGSGSVWFATSLQGGFVTYWFATSAAGPWSKVAEIASDSGGHLQPVTLSGAVSGNIPQPAPAVTTADGIAIVNSLKAMGLMH